jgi:hypothetical protein
MAITIKPSRQWLLEQLVFLFNVLGFVLAALPAQAPVANEKLETKSVYLHARLEADA